MFPIKITLAAAALVSLGGLSACADDYGYGGVQVGYGATDWDPYYGGYNADPYWGWYGDYYYPGYGSYVFDRRNGRHRWNDQQRGYWQGRSQPWRGANRQMRPMWRDYGVQGRPGAGARGGFGRGGGVYRGGVGNRGGQGGGHHGGHGQR